MTIKNFLLAILFCGVYAKNTLAEEVFCEISANIDVSISDVSGSKHYGFSAPPKADDLEFQMFKIALFDFDSEKEKKLYSSELDFEVYEGRVVSDIFMDKTKLKFVLYAVYGEHCVGIVKLDSTKIKENEDK